MQKGRQHIVHGENAWLEFTAISLCWPGRDRRRLVEPLQRRPRPSLSVKLEGPSFNVPIYANLFDDEDSEGYILIWSRIRKPNGD